MSRLLSAYGGSFYTSTAFLAVMFIHRYFSVAKPAQLFLFRGKRITLWITYSLIIGSSCYFSCTYLLAPDEYSLKYVAPEILKIYGIVVQNTTGFISVLFDEENKKIRWKNVFHLTIGIFTSTLQNVIIFYCGFKIRRKIYCKNAKYSPSLRKLHSQFFKTLVFQVATLTILLVIPTIIILCLQFFQFQISLPTGILLSLFEIYPAIDSLIVMYIITDYHKAIKDCFNDFKKLFRCFRN